MRKKNDYTEEGLANIKNLMILLRERSKGLAKLNVDLEGLAKAVKKLPSDTRKAVEKFFLAQNNLFEQYCEIIGPNKEILAWKGKHPSYVEDLASEAFNAISMIQTPKYAQFYDEDFIKMCEYFHFEGGKENKNIALLQLYLTFFKGGSTFFFEKEGEIPSEEQEKDIAVDYLSIISKYNDLVLKKRKRPIRMDIIEDWFLNALDEEKQKKLLLAIGERPPLKLGGGIPKEMINFAEARKIKQELFPKGPWKTSERLIEGFYEPLTGLTTLRKKESYDWLRTTEVDYDSVGFENFPHGEKFEKFKVHGVKNSFEFFDLEEVLWLNRWGPNN